jgi:S1-C subfamily serine protease
LTHVAVGSAAATAGLAAGDRIYAVNEQPFLNETDFHDTIHGVLDSSATDFSLEVETRGHVRTVRVNLAPPTLTAQSGS